MDDAIKNRVKAEMDRQGLDMKGLSKLAGLGETYVRDALKRGRGGSLPALHKLACALGRSLDWLITGAEVAGGEFAPDKPPRRRLDTSVDRKMVDSASTDAASTIFEVDVRAGAGGGGVPVEAFVHDELGNAYAAEGIAAEWSLPPAIMQGVLHALARHIRAFEVIGDFDGAASVRRRSRLRRSALHHPELRKVFSPCGTATGWSSSACRSLWAPIQCASGSFPPMAVMRLMRWGSMT